MVRIVFVLAVVAAFACGGAPLPPSNQAPPPGAAAATSDILGYLPIDSELVVGIDFRLLRSSALWREYRPVFVAALDKFALVTSNCGFDPLETIESGRMIPRR